MHTLNDDASERPGGPKATQKVSVTGDHNQVVVIGGDYRGDLAMKIPPRLQPAAIRSDNGPALPPELYQRLRAVLLRCGPFTDQAELRAVFTDARIAPWRDRLPTVNTERGRVEGLISFLLPVFSDTENGLVLFLYVLCDRLDPGDTCHRQLRELIDELKQAIKALSETLE